MCHGISGKTPVSSAWQVDGVFVSDTVPQDQSAAAHSDASKDMSPQKKHGKYAQQ